MTQDKNAHLEYDGTMTNVVIPMPADHGAVIGDLELWAMADQMQTALTALAWNRMDDQHDAAAWGSTLQDIDRLQARLSAIRSVSIGRHKAAGGSVNDLAISLDMPKSTAQYVQKKALEDDGRYIGWVTRRHDDDQLPQPGSDWWKQVMGARLRRAIDTNNPALLAEVTQAAADHGMHPTEFLDEEQPAEITARQENVLLHLAITALVNAQLDSLNPDARKSYLAITSRTERAKAVVKLYAGKSNSLVSGDNQQAITDAYHLATHIIETETETEAT